MGRDLRESNRRSIRLPGYDYSQAGAYFVTICTKDRECLFGEITNRKMALNDAGRMVGTVWHELPKFYPRASTDAFQAMPNHIHGIIVITRQDAVPPVGAGPRACPFPCACPFCDQLTGGLFEQRQMEIPKPHEQSDEQRK